MSIEDIDYLNENSEKDMFILYTDSALRNKRVYQHPSMYTMSFEQPFKNVYGIDVLDASIPSVQYNVESGENSVAGWIWNLNPLSTTDGYTSQSLLIELANFNEFDLLLNSSTIVTQIAGGATSYETGIVFLTSFDLISSYMATLANSNNPTPSITDYAQTGTGYWVYQRGVVQSAVIFNAADLLTFDSPTYDFTYGGVTYQIINDPANETYQNLITIVSTYFPIVEKNTDGSFNLIYYQLNEVPKSFIVTLRNNENNVMYLLDMSFFYVTYRAGNYDVTSFLSEAKNGAFGSTIITPNTVITSNASIIPKLTFASTSAFVLNMDNSTARTSMGFDEYADILETTDYVALTYKENFSLFSSVYDSTLQQWNITAPGVIYLLGTRYVILRCPEIESHMHGSRAFGQFSPGIGMFKMYAVNDISHQRFDFVNFVKKPFHPIGKLSQMTFRFEKTDGTLYDFKGANHLMLICVKYLVPSQKRKFVGSMLAPNYTIDFHSYLARHMDSKEKSDDDEEVDMNDLKNKFLLKEKQYDYSSTEGDDEDDEDDEDDVDITKFHLRGN